MLDISAALRAPGKSIPFAHTEELTSVEVLGEQVTFPQPALIKGTFNLVDESLVIKARLRATARSQCARCLNPVDYPVDVPMSESFLRTDPRAQVEDDPWEENLVFSGHKVDLSHLAQSLVLLELPIRFLCKENCEGLSHQTPGESPDSQNEPLDEAHPFDALKQLYTKFQEE